jgi:hypothetical protein
MLIQSRAIRLHNRDREKAEKFVRKHTILDRGAILTDWQPIETAPKDGTRVIIFYSGDNFWDVCEARYTDAEGWGDPNGCEWSCFADVTHWMPLPDPPRLTP